MSFENIFAVKDMKERCCSVKKKKEIICVQGQGIQKTKKKKGLGILGRTNVHFLMEIHPAALHLARETRAWATNTACFKSGTFEIGVTGEYCF